MKLYLAIIGIATLLLCGAVVNALDNVCIAMTGAHCGAPSYVSNPETGEIEWNGGGDWEQYWARVNGEAK